MSCDRAKVGKRSRNKGNSNERQLAKLFEGWWKSGTVSRLPLSGGWSNKKAFDTCGDLKFSDPLSPFHLEAKDQEAWRMENIFTSDKCIVWTWWNQTLTECPSGKIPTLIFRRNHVPQFVMLKLDDVPDLGVFSNGYVTFKGLFITTLEEFMTVTNRDYWLNPRMKDTSYGTANSPPAPTGETKDSGTPTVQT